VVGSRGMPRQYYRYVPQFESLHVWAAAGATAFLVGLVLVVLTVRRVHVAPPVAKVFD